MVTTERLAALSDAYRECQRLAQQHPENFPVASWLLPRRLRPHVAAIYSFARTADDFADEPGRTPGERLQLLDEWNKRLRATDLAPSIASPIDAAKISTGSAPASLFAALAHTRREFDLPISLFEDLLSAFRQDVEKTRYETWEEVFDYCRRSANPVGRLVLRLFGYNSSELDRYSDAVCTALQLTNFWQDLAIDWSRGRLYVPAEEWRAAGAQTADLDARRMTPAWQTALKQAAAHTRQLFDEGRPIADRVDGRLRYELRATWLGGTRILDRVERANFDVFNHRPTVRFRDGLVIAWRAVTWQKEVSSSQLPVQS
jgi:phytoene synthase